MPSHAVVSNSIPGHKPDHRERAHLGTVEAPDERSAKALAKYEGLLAKAREAGAAERDRLRGDAQKKEAEQLARVRAQVATTVEQGRAAIASEAKNARHQLNIEAGALGRAIAARLLGREVSQ